MRLRLVRAAKIFVVTIAIAAMFVAPLLAGQASIFAYLRKMNGIYFIPIFSVVLVGMLHPRVPGTAAFSALIVGLLLLTLKYLFQV